MGDSNREDFYKWLVSNKINAVAPAEHDSIFQSIEDFCTQIKILHRPIFSETDDNVLKRIQQTIQSNKVFRMHQKGRINLCFAAIVHYRRFLVEAQKEQSLFFLQSKAKKSGNMSSSSVEKNNNGPKTIDLKSPPGLFNTMPLSYRYFENLKVGFASWEELYVSLVSSIYNDYSECFYSGMSFSKSGKKADFGNSDFSGSMAKPSSFLSQNGSEWFVETGYPPFNLICRIRSILDFCSIDYNQIEISFYENTEKINNNANVFINKSSENDFGIDDSIVRLLATNDIEYIDKRSAGGNLWIICGKDSGIIKLLKKHSISLYYSDHGGTATDNKPAWWTTEQYESSELDSIKEIQFDDSVDSLEDTYGASVPVNYDSIVYFNGSNFDDFENTRPYSCIIKGRVFSEKNWAKTLAAIVEREIEECNPRLDDLTKVAIVTDRNGRPFFLENRIDGRNCAKLSNGYWLNLNHSIPRLMTIIIRFCEYVG